MTSPELEAGVRPGDVLAGKYRVDRVLGAGGMGVVVAAHHIQLDERVALKFLLPQAVRSPDSIARFVREARAAVKIKNEHVARVIDVGQLDNGSPYMVMEYLEGGDLAAWIEQRGVLAIDLAVDFVLQTCEALAEAHALGIVHRDLKPANLFCVQRPDGQLSIKVLDFGISKVTTPGAPGHGMTKTHALMGSPYYMSPEQMQLAKGVDARADIWALGVVLFELLTARPPFNAESVMDLAVKIATEPTPALRAFRGDAPEGLEQVIMTCMQKDRALRFQSVGELAIALKDYGPRHARASVHRTLGTLRMAGLSEAVLVSTGAVPAAARSSPDLGDFTPRTRGRGVAPTVEATQNQPPAEAIRSLLGDTTEDVRTELMPVDQPQRLRGASTTAGTAQTNPPARTAPGTVSSRQALAGVGVVAVLAALAGVSVLALRKPDTPVAPAAASSALALPPIVATALPTAAATAPPTAPSPSSAVPTISVADLPVAQPAVVAAIPAAPIPAPPPALARTGGSATSTPPNCDPLLGPVDARCAGHSTPLPTPVPPPVAGTAPNCDIPYTLDDQGNKHFKGECFLKKK